MQKIVSLVLGTGAGAAMVCGAAVGLGQLRFRRQVDAEVAALLHQERRASRSIVCADDLAGLPQPIRRWLEHACSRARVEPGVLLRYLTETVWFPAALLSPLVTWQPIDNTTAQATLEYRGTRASATFTIDGNGAVLRADAERYRANTASTCCATGRFPLPNTANSQEPGCPWPVRRPGVSTVATCRTTAGESPASRMTNNAYRSHQDQLESRLWRRSWAPEA